MFEYYFLPTLNSMKKIAAHFKVCPQCAMIYAKSLSLESCVFLFVHRIISYPILCIFFVHRIISYPILPLPQHIRYYFSNRELGGANTIIVRCSNREKYDLLLVERLDLRSSKGKTNSILVYNTTSWRSASHMPCVEGSRPPHLVFYDRAPCRPTNHCCQI